MAAYAELHLRGARLGGGQDCREQEKQSSTQRPGQPSHGPMFSRVHRHSRKKANRVRPKSKKPVTTTLKPMIRPKFLSHNGGESVRMLSKLPSSSSSWYSAGRSSWSCLSLRPPVKITRSIGNFSGRKWLLKKWMVKMNQTAKRASSA